MKRMFAKKDYIKRRKREKESQKKENQSIENKPQVRKIRFSSGKTESGGIKWKPPTRNAKQGRKRKRKEGKTKRKASNILKNNPTEKLHHAQSFPNKKKQGETR